MARTTAPQADEGVAVVGSLSNRIRPGMMKREASRIADQAADAWVEESQRHVPGHWKLHDNIRKEGGERGGTSRKVVADASGKGGRVYPSYQDQGTRSTPALNFWLPGRRAAEDVLRRGKLRP